MKLSKRDQKNLNVINRTLKNEYGYTVQFNESTPKKVLETINTKVAEQQRELSFSKNPQGNAEYSQCSLVLEATNILLGRKKEVKITNENKQRTVIDQIDEIESLMESIKDRSPEQAEKLQVKLDALRSKVYMESKEAEISRMLKEDAQQAEVIMASKNLLDTVQGFQSKISDLLNKNLDPFIERVRSQYGSDVADKMYSDMDGSLTELMQSVKKSKIVFYNAVGVLSGEGDNSDSIGGDEGLGSDLDSDMDDLDADLATDDDSVDDIADVDDDSDASDSIEDLMSGDDDETDTGNFQRRPE